MYTYQLKLFSFYARYLHILLVQIPLQKPYWKALLMMAGNKNKPAVNNPDQMMLM